MQRGFTLVEILVVLAILGIAIGGVSLAVGSARAHDADLALERLRHSLEACAERASIRGRPLALELLADGYRFAAPDDDGRWREFAEAPLFSPRQLPDTLRWLGLRTGNAGTARRLEFGQRPPRFELALQGPHGTVLLVGDPSGRVVRRAPGATAEAAR